MIGLAATPGMRASKRPPVVPTLAGALVDGSTRERLMSTLDDLLAAKRKLDGSWEADRVNVGRGGIIPD